MRHRLKNIATLVASQGNFGTRRYVALEHVEGGTGRLGVLGVLGDHPTRESADLGCVAVESGDVLFGKLRPYLAKTWRADQPVYVSTELLALRPRHGIASSWLAYVVASRQFTEWAVATSEGTKMPRTSWEKVADFRLRSVPDLESQRAVADFLDRETARIAATIAAKRRLIEVIEERLAVVVRLAVLNDETMTPHPTAPLKRLWFVIDCKHRTPTYREAGFPVVSPGDVTPGDLDLSQCTRFVDECDLADLTSDGRRPRRGDIIYSRNASIGIAAYVTDDSPFTMGQDVCLITSNSQNQRFLAYTLNTVGLDQLEEAKVGSTFSRVNISQIKDLLVPAPSVAEQNRIVTTLDAEAGQIQKMRSALTRQIDLLIERRSALITAAVTGELDVLGSAE